MQQPSCCEVTLCWPTFIKDLIFKFCKDNGTQVSLERNHHSQTFQLWLTFHVSTSLDWLIDCSIISTLLELREISSHPLHCAWITLDHSVLPELPQSCFPMSCYFSGIHNWLASPYNIKWWEVDGLISGCAPSCNQKLKRKRKKLKETIKRKLELTWANVANFNSEKRHLLQCFGPWPSRANGSPVMLNQILKSGFKKYTWFT